MDAAVGSFNIYILVSSYAGMYLDDSVAMEVCYSERLCIRRDLCVPPIISSVLAVEPVSIEYTPSLWLPSPRVRTHIAGNRNYIRDVVCTHYFVSV
jgi:hypothetical protein